MKLQIIYTQKTEISIYFHVRSPAPSNYIAHNLISWCAEQTVNISPLSSKYILRSVLSARGGSNTIKIALSVHPCTALQRCMGPGFPQQAPPFSSVSSHSPSILVFVVFVMYPYGQLPSIEFLVYLLIFFSAISH